MIKNMEKEKWLNFKDIKPINKRRKPRFNYPDGEVLQGEIIDEIRVNNQVIDENTIGKNYVNLLQKIKLTDGRIIFRFCYYYINFDNENPKWIFGQYALALLEKQYQELIRKMKEKSFFSLFIFLPILRINHWKRAFTDTINITRNFRV